MVHDRQIFDDLTKEERDESLFVNAWDPWSIAGNGNRGDESLDGYYGRSTNVGVASWPLTNTVVIKRVLFC